VTNQSSDLNCLFHLKWNEPEVVKLTLLRVQDPLLLRQHKECIPGDRKRIFQRGWRRVPGPYLLPYQEDPVLEAFVVPFAWGESPMLQCSSSEELDVLDVDSVSTHMEEKD